MPPHRLRRPLPPRPLRSLQRSGPHRGHLVHRVASPVPVKRPDVRHRLGFASRHHDPAASGHRRLENSSIPVHVGFLEFGFSRRGGKGLEKGHGDDRDLFAQDLPPDRVPDLEHDLHAGLRFPTGIEHAERDPAGLGHRLILPKRIKRHRRKDVELVAPRAGQPPLCFRVYRTFG